MAKTPAADDSRAGLEEHLEIEEGKEIIDEDADHAVQDAGLIAAAQKVDHTEMASYACGRSWAQEAGV